MISDYMLTLNVVLTLNIYISCVYIYTCVKKCFACSFFLLTASHVDELHQTVPVMDQTFRTHPIFSVPIVVVPGNLSEFGGICHSY